MIRLTTNHVLLEAKDFINSHRVTVADAKPVPRLMLALCQFYLIYREHPMSSSVTIYDPVRHVRYNTANGMPLIEIEGGWLQPKWNRGALGSIHCHGWWKFMINDGCLQAYRYIAPNQYQIAQLIRQ